MAEKVHVVTGAANGSFKIDLPRGQVERIDVIDIDLVVTTKSGERLILAGAALEAMTAQPPLVQFADGAESAAALLAAVDKIETPQVSIPAMTSLTAYDPKLRDDAKAKDKADAEAETPPEAQQQQQVAPVQTEGEGGVEKLLAKAEQLNQDVRNKAFDPVPLEPFEPPSRDAEGPGDGMRTVKIPMMLLLEQGNAVGVSSVVDSVTGRTIIRGASGPAGTDTASGVKVRDPAQYAAEHINGGATDDDIYADGFAGLTNGGNLPGNYSATDGSYTGPHYYAKEFNLSVAGYIRRLNSVTFKNVPDGVIIEHATKNADGSWTLNSDRVVPESQPFNIVYDVTSPGLNGLQYITVVIEGIGNGPIRREQVFVFDFKNVTDVSGVTDVPPVSTSTGPSEVLVMPMYSAPHVIDAGAGNDRAWAGNSADRIYGGDGDDLIFAYAGDDVIYGDDGPSASGSSYNDAGYAAVAAGDGNDTIYAGTGNNTVYAGGGDDIVRAEGGNDKVWGGAGNDDIQVGAGNNTVDAGAGDDVVTAGAGNDKVWGGAGNDQIDVAGGNNWVDAGAGDDWVRTGSGDDEVWGGDGNDDIDVAGGKNTIQAGAGDDLVRSGDGDDKVWGGDGNDDIDVAAGNNSIYAGAGNDLVRAGDGDDDVTGGDGDDDIDVAGGNNTVDAGAGIDIVRTGAGNDTVWGGDGNDDIDVGAGKNFVEAGAGNDKVRAGSGNDSVTGGDGDDDIDVAAGNNTVDAGAGNDLVRSGAGNDTVWGGAGDDDIDVGDGQNHVEGGAGNNRIVTGSGIDRILAADGDNIILAGAGANSISLGHGLNQVTTGDDDDVILVGDGANILSLGAGKNTVTAGDGGNVITTLGGDDTIVTGAGDDQIDTGAGDDRIEAGRGNNIINAGAGIDWLNFAVADIDASNTGLVLTLDGNGNGTAQRGTETDQIFGLENLTATDDSDTITITGSSGAANHIVGRGGNDTISSGDGSDTVYGDDGDDVLDGGADADTVYGGTGADSITGGAGADLLYGGDGDDVFIAGLADGADLYSGGSGWDKVDYSGATATDMTIYLNGVNNGQNGSAAGDLLTAIEWVIGGNNRDYIYGTAADEWLEGGNGDDMLVSNGGNDVLYGDRRTSFAGATSVDATGSSAALMTNWSNPSSWGNNNFGSGTNWANINYEGDRLFGSTGNTTMYGGAGYNQYFMAAGLETVHAQDGQFDRVTYQNVNANGTAAVTGMAGSGVFINIDGTDHRVGSGGTVDGIGAHWWNGSGWVSMGGSLAFSNTNANSGQFGAADKDRFFGAEQAVGSQNADVIFGSGDDNYIDGQGGNDALFGLGGNDWIRASSGVDYIDGGDNSAVGLATGGDIVDYSGYAASSTAIVSANLSRTDGWVKINNSLTFSGAAQLRNVEGFLGTGYADHVTGSSSADRIDPRGGNDTVLAGAGADIVYGGWGNSSGSGDDYLDGGTGAGADGTADSDWISYSGISAVGGTGLGIEVYLADADLDGDGSLDQISTGFTATTGFSRYHKGGYEKDTLLNFENVEGSLYNDRIAGNVGANSLYGLAGNDTIDGGAGADTIDGGANTDTVWYHNSSAGVTVDLSLTTAQSGGDASGDILHNIENIRGSGHADTLTGNGGDNEIEGGQGGDVLNGGTNGSFGDTVSYSSSNAGVTINLATQTASGGHAAGDVISNFENVRGSAHADTLTGNSGNNILWGGAGNDTLIGNGGNDALYGEDGNDSLTVSSMTSSTSILGGTGTDTLVCAGWNLASNYNAGRIDSIEGINVKDGAGMGSGFLALGNSTTTVNIASRISEILDTSSGKLTLLLDNGDRFYYAGASYSTASGAVTSTNNGGTPNVVAYGSNTTATFTYGSYQLEVQWS